MPRGGGFISQGRELHVIINARLVLRFLSFKHGLNLLLTQACADKQGVKKSF